jgi:eukaryotic-like serine/threonine-protein kinase
MKLCPQCKTEYPGGEVFCPLDGSRLQSPSELHAQSASPDDPLVGTTLAERYRVIRRIGEGGMGLVYEAEHAVIEKRVALKVLREDFSSRPEVVQRFQLEAKSASRIGHEHIVDISDFGTMPSGASYFVMEFLDGEDLANVLAREGTIPAERAVRILLQCCRALGAAHSKGIVHRDMKPENIFLTHRGDNPDFVKIVDFGIAKMSDIETDGAPGRKLTKTGMIFGTPEYMSPEQAAGKKLDHRVDTYAMGVILFECLVGRVPFVGDTFMGVLTQHMFEDPPAIRELNPSTTASPELESVVYKALAKAPEDRFQTMDDLHDAMEAALAGDGDGTFVGYGDPVKMRATPRRANAAARVAATPDSSGLPRAALLSAAALLLVVLSGTGVWLYARASAPIAPEPLTRDAPANPSVNPTPSTVTPDEVPAVAPPEIDPSAPAVAVGSPDAGARVASPAAIAIRVETRPSGASIRAEVGNGDEVVTCEPTPCTIEAPSGVPLVVRAQRGRAVGSRELTPSEAATVRIVLRSRPSGRPAPSGGQTTTMRPSSDLKIPDIFR